MSLDCVLNCLNTVNILASCLRHILIQNGQFTLENDASTLSVNSRHLSPDDTAPQPRRTDTAKGILILYFNLMLLLTSYHFSSGYSLPHRHFVWWFLGSGNDQGGVR